MGTKTIESNGKRMILKTVQIILGGLYVLVMLFYLSVILPEYLTCVDCNTEGAMRTDFLGDSVQCFGDSKVFGQVLFDFSTLTIVGFSVLLVVLFLWRRFKSNT